MKDTGSRFARGWEEGFTGAQARLLGALGKGYTGLLDAREWLYARAILKSRSLPVPVVSVGNLTVGGTGKTPAVEIAVQTLAALGHRPAIVSRGYGRRTGGLQIVADAASIRLDGEEAGDEPFLLARRLPGIPVVVGSNRYDSARLALDRFAVTAIVLDDAFQHRTLKKDLEVVMARARNPWGNGKLLPAGPLREPLSALRRADLVVATGAQHPEDAKAVASVVSEHAPGVPILTAVYALAECWEANRMRLVSLDQLPGKHVLAFAGIAAPRAFEETLRSAGVSVEQFSAFADHHWYTAAEIAALDRRASDLGVEAIMTTEKDWVRLRKLPLPRRFLYVLSIRLVLTSGGNLWQSAFKRACPTG